MTVRFCVRFVQGLTGRAAYEERRSAHGARLAPCAPRPCPVLWPLRRERYGMWRRGVASSPPGVGVRYDVRLPAGSAKARGAALAPGRVSRVHVPVHAICNIAPVLAPDAAGRIGNPERSGRSKPASQGSAASRTHEGRPLNVQNERPFIPRIAYLTARHDLCTTHFQAASCIDDLGVSGSSLSKDRYQRVPEPRRVI